jgi:hypothetical protein
MINYLVVGRMPAEGSLVRGNHYTPSLSSMLRTSIPASQTGTIHVNGFDIAGYKAARLE